MMMFLRKVIRGVVAACLIGLSACASSSTTGKGGAALPGNGVKTEGADVGNLAYEIEGASAADGKPIQLSKHKGKVVLLDFWATWCPPCVAAIPHEKQLVARYAGRPFALIGISMDRTEEALVKFIGKSALPWPNIFDEGERISEKWNVGAVPTFVLINPHGEIVGRWEGAQDLPEIDKSIEYELKLVENKK